MQSFILEGTISARRIEANLTDRAAAAGPERGGRSAGRSLLSAFAPALAWGILVGWLAAAPVLRAAGPPVVPKWARFEQVFKSSFGYVNPLQSATLTVVFTSPLGETSQVYGFWDGGKIWRVRFAPDQLGRWTFKTTCSDVSNQGLHRQSGEFLCTAPIGQNRFHEHGLIQVARDHRHLEHADGTPFFWLADTVWNGARVSEPRAWELYAQVRSDQNFSVAQWAVAPGADDKNQSALTGFPDQIGVNPEFFRRLEAKLETLTQAGILSAIVPLAETGPQADASAPTEAQGILFVRYVVARFGADPVAWLLAFDADNQGKKVGRWKRIGYEVFAGTRHAPVVLYPGQTPWLLDEFRDQAWVDVFGFPTVTDVTDDALRWTFAGPVAGEWAREPARPLIPFTPYENGIGAQSKKRFSAAEVRRAAYWGLLLAPPAGVSYGGQGIVNWDTTADPRQANAPGSGLPLWQKALFMPAAKQMGHLAQLMNALEYWRLRPEAKALATQPGEKSPSRQILAACAEKKVALLYVPEDRDLELFSDALPPAPVVTWFNPRQGESSPAVSVTTTPKCQFPTPGPEDWVLLMRAGR